LGRTAALESDLIPFGPVGMVCGPWAHKGPAPEEDLGKCRPWAHMSPGPHNPTITTGTGTGWSQFVAPTRIQSEDRGAGLRLVLLLRSFVINVSRLLRLVHLRVGHEPGKKWTTKYAHILVILNIRYIRSPAKDLDPTNI
jgi:hypothetical protein